MSSISAIIHTKNAAATLKRTLDSLSFVQEKIVIDMESQDDTLVIARSLGAKTFSIADSGYVEPARNFGIQQAQEKFVLIVDADEEIPPKLGEKLLAISTMPAAADGYYLPRKNLIFNRWIEHTGWWPDYQLRFFKKGTVVWSEKIHAAPQTKGTFELLPANENQAILHHNYQTIEQFIERMNRYTNVAAATQPATTKEKHLSEPEILGVFFNEFISRLFTHHGIQDGVHGVSLSLLQSMYEAVISLKLWQKHAFFSQTVNEAATIKELRLFQKHLNYWIASYQIEKNSGAVNFFWRVRRKLLI